MIYFVFFILGTVFSGIIGSVLWFLRYKRQRLRLLMLSDYLEAASCGKEGVLVRKEDEFSLLEDELYKTVGELRVAREKEQQERIQQANNMADIAHQLKTPLTSMSLMAQLLTDNASSQQLEYIRIIESQLIRMNWLTSSLLTMSRFDAGAVDFIPTTITFEELSDRASESMEQLIDERGQYLYINDKDTLIYCDPYWTTEVLINLIKNCSEHMKQGDKVVLSAMSTPLYVQITVEDNGAGFIAEEIPCLFRRFFKGKNSSKDSIGIGLALCRGIIEGQGGIIRAENNPDGGARFIIRLYSGLCS